MRQRAKILNEKIALAKERYKGAKIGDGTVEIIAVSKFHPVEAIQAAQSLGFTLFGENRVQELSEKLADSRLENYSFDLIGTLQTNKVKNVVGHVRLIHSLDRDSLLKAIQKRAAQLSIEQDVLLQVNYSEEDSKHGVNDTQVKEFLEKIARCTNINLRGLMTMAAPGLNEAEQDKFFKAFRELFDETKESLPAQINQKRFNILSMGMSEDFEAALAAGSNCIRIGRAIFGERI